MQWPTELLASQPTTFNNLANFLGNYDMTLKFYNRHHPDYLGIYYEIIVYSSNNLELEITASNDQDGKRISLKLNKNNELIKSFFSGYSSNKDLIDKTVSELKIYMKESYS